VSALDCLEQGQKSITSKCTPKGASSGYFSSKQCWKTADFTSSVDTSKMSQQYATFVKCFADCTRPKFFDCQTSCDNSNDPGAACFQRETKSSVKQATDCIAQLDGGAAASGGSGSNGASSTSNNAQASSGSSSAGGKTWKDVNNCIGGKQAECSLSCCKTGNCIPILDCLKNGQQAISSKCKPPGSPPNFYDTKACWKTKDLTANLDYSKMAPANADMVRCFSSCYKAKYDECSTGCSNNNDPVAKCFKRETDPSIKTATNCIAKLS